MRNLHVCETSNQIELCVLCDFVCNVHALWVFGVVLEIGAMRLNECKLHFNLNHEIDSFFMLYYCTPDCTTVYLLWLMGIHSFFHHANSNCNCVMIFFYASHPCMHHTNYVCWIISQQKNSMRPNSRHGFILI